MTLQPIGSAPPNTVGVADADVTWLDPQIKCPNCGSIVNGLGDAKEELPAPKPTFFNRGGEVKTGPAVLVWRAHPCNCKISTEWAGAYAKEVQNRRTGGKPGQVQAMTPGEREARRKQLEKAIANLMILKETYEKQMMQAMASKMPGPPVGELSKVERELVTKVDALMKLFPGKHNLAVPTTSLSQDTLAWAGKHKLSIPTPPVPQKLEPTVAEIAKFLVDSPTGYEGQKHVVNPSKVADAVPHHTAPALQTLPTAGIVFLSHNGLQTVNPITGEKLPPGAVVGGAMPFALEFKIEMVDGPGVPKQGDIIVDEHNHAIGRVAHVKKQTTSDGYVACSIQVIPVAAEVKGPQAGPSAKLATTPVPKHPKEMTPADLVAKGKEIQKNIIDHQEHGTPLTEEAKRFLAEYGALYQGSLPASSPAPASRASGKILTKQQLALDKFLTKATRKERQKIARVRPRRKDSGDG